MTYYKYAERQADSQVNWAEVSKGLSDTILKIDSDRQAKKAAIDEATREAQIELANAPQGENTTANAWTINLAHDMMNYRLTIDKLLKSGQMNLKDYQVATQNSADSTELVFTIAQEYQNEYKAIMDRSRTIGKNGLPLSSVLEPELAALNESYANLSNTVPTINSTNGMLYLSNPGTGKDGVQTLGDNYVSLQSLRNRMKAKIDNYDVKGVSAAAVATLGENTIAQLNRDENFRRTGVVTTTTDSTKLTKIWTEFTESTAEDMITNPFARASILADAMRVNPKNGKAYTGVYNRAEWEADKTGNLILFENTNGTGPLVPVFTDQQTKDAKEFVKAGFSKYVDRKEDKRPFTEPGIDYAPEYISRNRENDRKNKEGEKTGEIAAGSWNQLYTGKTIAAKKAAASILLGTPQAQKAGLLDIDFVSEPGKLILRYQDDKRDRRIDFTDENGNPTNSLRDWSATGVEVHGVVDREQAFKAGGGGTDFGKISNYEDVRASRKGKSSKTNLPLSAITEESGKASSNLQSALPEGFVVRDNSIFGMGNGITVVAPNGKTYEYTSKKGVKDAVTFKIELEKWVNANSEPVKATDTKDKSPIADPGDGTFGSGSAKRKIKG